MVELETRTRKSRSEIGSILEDVASQLDSDGPITVQMDGRSMELNPAEPVTFEVEGETEREMDRTEGTLEFTLEWTERSQTDESAGGAADSA